MNARRWFTLVSLLVIVSMLPVGCSKGGGGASQPSGKNLRLVVRRFPAPSLPYYKATTADPLMYSLLYDTLLTEDSSGNLKPLLADEWKPSDDQMTLTFKLNADATNHKGEPMLVKDVLYSFTLLKGGSISGAMGGYFACVDKMEEVNEREVKFTFNKACPEAAKDIGGKVLVINRSSANPEIVNNNYPTTALLSGSGAFDVDGAATVQGKKLVLRATGKHYRLKPIVDTVTFEVVEDENVAESSVKIADVWPQIFGQ